MFRIGVLSRRFSTSAARPQLINKPTNNIFSPLALLGLGAVLTVSSATTYVYNSGDNPLHPLQLPWHHNGFASAYDAAAMRRGHQVFTQICAACHSLEMIAFRHLVGVIMTEEEAKNYAAEFDITDGPNDSGEMFERPGKLFDYIPSPYKNEAEARLANNGALPPDLSLMTKARDDGQNYLFSLLTGYKPAPEGIQIRPGLHYNPYFVGGAIAMAKQLQDGGVEYEDGTPATETQMAKDVTTFLAWCAEPEHDERKRRGLKMLSSLTMLLLMLGWYKRHVWSIWKARKISYL